VLVRAINTNSFVLSADQPLLGLLHLDRDYAALQSTADAAQESQRAVEAAVREDALIQLLTLFESRALGETARASERQLGDQLAVMESKLQAGVATQADVLRLKVALANARQQEIQARAQEQVARANLLSALGRDPADRSTQFAEPMELLDLAEPIPTLVSAVERGLDRRPELASAQLQTQAARQRSQGRLFQLLPEVDLEAAYIHVQGQVFFPLNSTFVGVKADWPIFQWGARLYDQRAADRQAAAAASDQEATRRRIGTEVSARLSQLEAASFAVEVAQTTIASAEEAYRVTQALAQAGSATTTDLLDAQAALTQARLNLVRARYQMAIARVALARATGF
jgi:outer membrane protein TolC